MNTEHGRSQGQAAGLKRSARIDIVEPLCMAAFAIGSTGAFTKGVYVHVPIYSIFRTTSTPTTEHNLGFQDVFPNAREIRRRGNAPLRFTPKEIRCGKTLVPTQAGVNCAYHHDRGQNRDQTDGRRGK